MRDNSGEITEAIWSPSPHPATGKTDDGEDDIINNQQVVMDWPMRIILFNVVLYAMAWQLFAPMIPYFLQSIGGDQFQVCIKTLNGT
jgi:hypothetical protein